MHLNYLSHGTMPDRGCVSLFCLRMSHAKSVLGKRKAHIEEGESPSLECYETLDMEQVRKDARQFAAAEDEKRKQQPLPPKTIDPLSSASSCSSSTESLKRAVSSLTVNPPSVQAVVSHQKSSDTTATVHVNVIKNLLDLDNDPDLVSYMLATEKAYHPDGNYMCVQNVINNETRAVMMDWMMAIAHEFELTHETLYLALNYADRHMAREVMIAHPNSELLIPTSQLPVQPRRPSAISTPAQSIDRKNYQCFGIACLQIAAKFEQLMLPNAHDLVAATASSCTIGQLNEMELNVLRGLNYRLSAQTPHAWLKLFLKLMVMESRNKMALPDDAKMSNVEMEMQREFECMRAASDPFVQSVSALSFETRHLIVYVFLYSCCRQTPCNA